MTRKFLSVIFAVLICLICTASAFADCGGYFTPFTATVDAQAGTVLYDQIWSSDMTRSIMRPMSIFVPNGTNLLVTGEREFEGEIYLAVEYDGFQAYVQRSKVTIMRDSVGDDLAFPTKSERSVAVINKEGIALRKGPSLAYGKALEENIPYGTVLSYTQTNSEAEALAQWAYTEYKGTKGWVYIFQSGIEDIYDCAFVLDDEDIYTGSVEVLTDGAFLTETAYQASAKVASDIPAGTVMSFRYFYENLDYSVSVFVEYNGVKGWLHTMNPKYKVAMSEKGGVYVLAEKGLPMYEAPLDTDAEVIATLPANTNLCVDKQYWFADVTLESIKVDRWMYVEFDGTKGWVYSGDPSEYCYMSNVYDIKVNSPSGLEIYAEPDTASKILGNVPSNETVTCVYESASEKDGKTAYWSYITCNGINGWVFATDDEASYVEGSEKFLDAPFGAEKISRRVAENAPKLKDGLPAAAIIGICVAAAVAVAAIIIVIVKKKKTK